LHGEGNFTGEENLDWTAGLREKQREREKECKKNIFSRFFQKPTKHERKNRGELKRRGVGVEQGSKEGDRQ